MPSGGLTGEGPDRRDEVSQGLRAEGLEAALGDDGLIHVGSAHRGVDAPAAVVDLREGGVDEYAAVFAVDGDPEPERARLQHERFVLRLAEDLTALHSGGETNLTTGIRLRRDRRGRLRLDETRSGPGAPLPLDGDGHAWAADR